MWSEGVAGTVTRQIAVLALCPILRLSLNMSITSLWTVVGDGGHEVARVQVPLAGGLSVCMQNLANEVLALLGYI